MLNRYPLWKYIMLVVVIIAGLLYSLPTLYGEDPAIQVSSPKQNLINETTLTEVKTYLTQENLEFKSISLDDGKLLIRLTEDDEDAKVAKSISHFLNKGDKGSDNLYDVAPNLAPASPSWFQYIGAQPIKKGLDLRGGVYFLLEIDMSNFIDKKLIQLRTEIASDFKENNITYYKVDNVKTDNSRTANAISIVFPNEANLEQGQSQLRKYNQYDFEQNNNELIVTFKPAALAKFESEALEQNVLILRNRISQLGVSEPVIQTQGSNRISVQLPGIQDTVEAKKILGATATLEFRSVNSTELRPNYSLAQAVAEKRVTLPLDSELYFLKGREGQSDYAIPYLLYKQIILSGDHITDAKARLDDRQGVVVDIALDSEGGKKMLSHTQKNVGQGMATLYIEYKQVPSKTNPDESVLEKNSELANVARINDVLSNRFQISGIGDIEEARRLAILLRSGSLTAPVKIIEENVIGPSMGKERIQQGLESCLYGLLFTILFMLLAYKLFGVFASLAVTLNLILIVAIMSIIPGATLTMPGIAGIVLTVGMAVDANVLINERIKEELRIGRNPQQAIDSGYKGAWTSIFDANITTLMTAVILYFAGTGSIKGFAITLGIGVLTSMFTSIVGTRALANLIYGRRRVNKLSI